MSRALKIIILILLAPCAFGVQSVQGPNGWHDDVWTASLTNAARRYELTVTNPHYYGSGSITSGVEMTLRGEDIMAWDCYQAIKEKSRIWHGFGETNLIMYTQAGALRPPMWPRYFRFNRFMIQAFKSDIEDMIPWYVKNLSPAEWNAQFASSQATTFPALTTNDVTSACGLPPDFFSTTPWRSLDTNLYGYWGVRLAVTQLVATANRYYFQSSYKNITYAHIKYEYPVRQISWSLSGPVFVTSTNDVDGNFTLSGHNYADGWNTRTRTKLDTDIDWSDWDYGGAGGIWQSSYKFIGVKTRNQSTNHAFTGFVFIAFEEKWGDSMPEPINIGCSQTYQQTPNKSLSNFKPYLYWASTASFSKPVGVSSITNGNIFSLESLGWPSVYGASSSWGQMGGTTTCREYDNPGNIPPGGWTDYENETYGIRSPCSYDIISLWYFEQWNNFVYK